MKLVAENPDAAVFEVQCVECGFTVCIPVSWVRDYGPKPICSACWAPHARTFRLQRLAEAVRPLAHDELKEGTTPSLFGPLNKRR